MSIGKFVANYSDDLFNFFKKSSSKSAFKHTEKTISEGVFGQVKEAAKIGEAIKQPTVGQFFTDIQGITGKTSVTFEGKALERVIESIDLPKGEEAGIFAFLQKMLGKCKKPSLTFGAKASKNGFNVAGISLRDGEQLVASGAFSVTTKATKSGVKPQVYKMRLNTSDGAISGRAHHDITKIPSVTDKIGLSMNADNLVLDAKGQIGGTYGAELHLDLNKLADDRQGALKKAVKEANAYITEGFKKVLEKSPLI